VWPLGYHFYLCYVWFQLFQRNFIVICLRKRSRERKGVRVSTTSMSNPLPTNVDPFYDPKDDEPVVEDNAKENVVEANVEAPVVVEAAATTGGSGSSGAGSGSTASPSPRNVTGGSSGSPRKRNVTSGSPRKRHVSASPKKGNVVTGGGSSNVVNWAATVAANSVCSIALGGLPGAGLGQDLVEHKHNRWGAHQRKQQPRKRVGKRSATATAPDPDAAFHQQWKHHDDRVGGSGGGDAADDDSEEEKGGYDDPPNQKKGRKWHPWVLSFFCWWLNIR